MLPLFPLPGIFRLKRDVDTTTLTTEQFWIKNFMPTNSGWIEQNKVETIASIPASIQLGKFGMLIAKIAHAYAAAELGPNISCQLLLADAIRNEPGAPPLGFLVGGEEEVLPPTTELHEVELIRRQTNKHSLTLVRVRLFAKFGAPTYYAVVSHELRNKRR